MNGKQPEKVTLADAKDFLKSQGISLAAVAKFKRNQKKTLGLSPKQVERALMSKGRDKLKTLCHHVSVTGHAHFYLSVMGDKVVITGIDQLKANPKPFNRRGFGSTKHPTGAAGATAIKIAKAKDKKAPFLSRISLERRKEIGRQGGLAAAKKRAEKAAMKAKRGPHWTQMEKYREKKDALVAKMVAANKAKRAKKVAGA